MYITTEESNKIKEKTRDHIGRALKKSGLTQDQLARKIGGSQGNVSKWLNEDDPVSPPAEKLYWISKALGVSGDYLLGLSETESPDESIQGAVKATHLSEQAVMQLNDHLNKVGESRIHPFINALLESPYLSRIAYEFNQLLTNKDLYLDSEKRHADIIQEVEKSSAVGEEEMDFIKDPSWMKNADFDRLKFSQFKLVELFTRFAVSISEGEDQHGEHN